MYLTFNRKHQGKLKDSLTVLKHDDRGNWQHYSDFIHIKAFMAQSGIRTTPEQVLDFDEDSLKGKDTLNL